jgi:hypothetical protein
VPCPLCPHQREHLTSKHKGGGPKGASAMIGTESQVISMRRLFFANGLRSTTNVGLKTQVNPIWLSTVH